jgi:uroporphyrin-III C-methyltransferase/precorrin-2 dehydrogenase/sirohydrochlorin ferrochelatase
MRSLPLFHRVAGQPVIVLGAGAAAEAKRRLVERAGGQVVADTGTGARLAFVAHDDPALCEADAARLRAAGLLVNVVDRPDLCDFTTPSILDRDPVLIAVGTDGTSAGLAKHVRLRLEALLPANLGRLADALYAARDALRARWPDAAERRRALDGALEPGGPLDPLGNDTCGKVAGWLEGAEVPAAGHLTLTIASDDPDDLTLRQARMLGQADTVLFDPRISPAILDRARADAVRIPLPHDGPEPRGLVLTLRAVTAS